MSKWWKVTMEVPENGVAITRDIIEPGRDAQEAHESAVAEFSKRYSRVRVVDVEQIADEDEDETVGGYDEEGPLPRQQEKAPPSATQPRLHT